MRVRLRAFSGGGINGNGVNRAVRVRIKIFSAVRKDGGEGRRAG